MIDFNTVKLFTLSAIKNSIEFLSAKNNIVKTIDTDSEICFESKDNNNYVKVNISLYYTTLNVSMKVETDGKSDSSYWGCVTSLPANEIEWKINKYLMELTEKVYRESFKKC